ncbi:MAG TPA: TerC family protein [Thermomicrobiales bacterium]|jgi:YjbE family integral membrane protein|nr:TerC family protein [Thermomicrobiales bacterium]
MALIEALLAVILVNLVLSGDNAVVIGLAARSLPPRQRQRAIILGGGAAVLLRLALTIPAELLLNVPYLRAGGGLLLAWVAYRLLTEEDDPLQEKEAASVAQAVWLIIIADATMSLDNVLAVAAVAERGPHEVFVLIFGLLLSIPIVLAGGSIVARLMHRLPWLVWVGGAILAYTAAELIVEDHGLASVLEKIPHVRIVFTAIFAVALLGLALLQNRRHASEDVAEEAAAAITRGHGEHFDGPAA